jgi:hypothetical protein
MPVDINPKDPFEGLFSPGSSSSNPADPQKPTSDPFASEKEDILQELLQDRDYWLVVDRSGSMVTNSDTPTGQCRWDYVKESVLAIAMQLAKFDLDGISLVLFGNTVQAFENQKPGDIDQRLRKLMPLGGTILTPALQYVFKQYQATKRAGTAKPNGGLCVVITDGQPDLKEDENAAARAIVDFTKTLKDGRQEFGIEFLQVGRDPAATAFLQRLNDHLQKEGATEDVVNSIGIDDIERYGLVNALYKSLSE